MTPREFKRVCPGSSLYLQELDHLLHHSGSQGLLHDLPGGRKGTAEDTSSSLSEVERKDD